jgi:hypothetical protein
MMLKLALGFIFAANVADAILTDWGLSRGWVRELNPLMDMLYHKGTGWFYLVKLSLVCAMLLVVPKVQEILWIRRLYQLTGVVYVGVLLLHSIWIIRICTLQLQL